MASSTSTVTSSNAGWMNLFTEPVTSGLVATAIDRFILGNNDMKSNIAVGLSTFVGCYFGDSIAIGLTAGNVGDSALGNIHGVYSGNTVVTRALEFAGGAGLLYGAQRMNYYQPYYQPTIFNSNGQVSEYYKYGAIVGGQVLGTYLWQYWTTQPLNAFD